MYHDVHTHTIRPRKSTIAVYSMLPGPLPVALPAKTYVSAGIHPWLCSRDGFAAACGAFGVLPDEAEGGWRDYDEAMSHWLELLEQLAAQRQIAAVGEIGLDRSRDKDLSLQHSVFEVQLELAERHNLPVIVHCVRAFPELLALRKRFDGTPWIAHGYRGTAESAQHLIRHGIHLSFGEALLGSHQVQAVAGTIPRTSLFLETDQSACDIADIYAGAATALSMTPEALQRTVGDNFNMAFDRKL